MSLALFLRSVFDASEIVIELMHGEGGDDSKMFVDDLFSAYLKYAQSLGFKSELLHSSSGHMMAEIKGNKVGYAFQYESGKHCVQRVPPTETKGRRQTSIVSVAILPIPKKVNVEISEKDLKIEPVNLGGSGGQHQNRTLSGCRMTHLPTGTKVCINGRDYHSNERKARQILKARLHEASKQQIEAEYNGKRKKQIDGGGRSNKVRTYNFIRGEVVDHRLGTRTGDIKSIMKGNFNLILKDEIGR